MRPWLVVPLLLLAAGCTSADNNMLGVHNGFLATGADCLARPGQSVDVKIQLVGGQFLRDRPGYVVRFYRQGELFKAAETNDNGVARIAVTIERPGDVILSAGFSPNGFPEGPPPPVDVLVTVRPADAPLVIVDLDKTLVASDFSAVLEGKSLPMADSQRVMRRLAGEYTLVYLTHRPDMYGPKTRAWLAAQQFPRGPVLMADFAQSVGESGDFKRHALEKIRLDFTNLRFGIGDKSSDIRAYRDEGLHGIQLLSVDPNATAEELWDQVRQLQILDPDCDVVWNWNEVEQVIFERASFPPGRAQQVLMQRAGQADLQARAARELATGRRGDVTSGPALTQPASTSAPAGPGQKGDRPE